MWQCRATKVPTSRYWIWAGLFALARVVEVLLVRQQRHFDRSRGQLAQAVILGAGRRMLFPLEVLEVDFLGHRQGDEKLDVQGLIGVIPQLQGRPCDELVGALGQRGDQENRCVRAIAPELPEVVFDRGLQLHRRLFRRLVVLVQVAVPGDTDDQRQAVLHGCQRRHGAFAQETRPGDLDDRRQGALHDRLRSIGLIPAGCPRPPRAVTPRYGRPHLGQVWGRERRGVDCTVRIKARSKTCAGRPGAAEIFSTRDVPDGP